MGTDKKDLLTLHAIEQHSLPRINAQLEVATDPKIVKKLIKEKKRLEKVLKEIKER